jgi:hypothetical protein
MVSDRAPRQRVKRMPRPEDLDLRLYGVRGFFDASFEALYAFSEALTEFRQFLGAESEEGDGEDNEQVAGLKQSFKHELSPGAISR